MKWFRKIKLVKFSCKLFSHMTPHQFRFDTVQRDRMPNVNDARKFLRDLTLGASAAIVAKTIIAPIERVKLILQVYLECILNHSDFYVILYSFMIYDCVHAGFISKHPLRYFLIRFLKTFQILLFSLESRRKSFRASFYNLYVHIISWFWNKVLCSGVRKLKLVPKDELFIV